MNKDEYVNKRKRFLIIKQKGKRKGKYSSGKCEQWENKKGSSKKVSNYLDIQTDTTT